MNSKKFPTSFLYTPAINHKHLFDAEVFGADVSVVDLEDSIPENLKEAARMYLLEYANHQAFKPLKAVRINSIRQAHGLEDILWMVKQQWTPDIIIMTMLEDPAEISIVKALLPGHAAIYVTMETPLAIEGCMDIAALAQGMIFGSADLAATLGVNISWDNMFYARSKIAMAAAQFGIPAIDTACYVMDSPEVLQAESRRVRDMGFTGKAAIHPSQVQAINEVFTPDKQTLDQARLYVSTFEKNQGNIIKINGHMIGPPFYLKAKKTLERAGVIND